MRDMLRSAASLCFLLLSMTCSFCQEESKSSFERRMEKGYSELDRAAELIETDPISALEALENYLKSSKSFNSEDQLRIYHLTGRANYELGQYSLAITNYLRALNRNRSNYKKRSKVTSTFIDPEVYYDLSLAYRAKGEWSQALSPAQFYVDFIAKGYDQRLKFKSILNLGYILYEMDRVDEALEATNTISSIADSLKDPNLQLEASYLSGLVLEQNEAYDDALFNLNQAIFLSDSLVNNSKNEEISSAIGRAYRAQDDFDGELSFKTERREKSIAQNDLSQQNRLDLEIAELYIEKDQSNEAVPYLQESVLLSEQLGDLEQNISARKSLSDVYASTGNYNMALSNYRSYVELVDRLYENKQKEIELTTKIQQDLFTKQETISLLEKDQQLRESEFELLKKESALQEVSLARQRLFIYGLTALILVMFVSAFLLNSSNKKKRHANQLLALKSLRSQMNPHFIFNALNSVNSFISSNDTRQANKYLSDFSRLMRTVMENSQKDFVPLTEEIAMLELYLKLEHSRFREKFDYELTVPKELQVDHLKIPPMLIQPYIENAIWHGLRYKEDHGHLVVAIREEEGHLSMEVKDNGIGRRRSQQLKTLNQKAQTSTGMKNTEKRINLLNETYAGKITCVIEDMESGRETGTRVKVMVPFQLIEEPI